MISAWRYIEVVDGKGQPVPDGETGYIIVTDLTNYTMPFIRYRNEDMGRISKELCPCGRPSPVLEEILGRSTDLIRTPKGDIIHGEFFTHLFYGQNEIRQFQVHQKSLDHIILRYVADTEPSEALMNKLTGKIRAQIGENVRLDIEACNEIPLPASGKHRFTISDVRETDIT
jgi:phenylacetate-CoA ligase